MPVTQLDTRGSTKRVFHHPSQSETSMAQQTGAPRYEIQGLRAVYDTGDTFWCARVVDTSETGIFLETTHELDEGASVQLMFDFPAEVTPSEEVPLYFYAKVVRNNSYDLEKHWNRKHGIALTWEGLSPQQTQQLRSFLAQHGVQIRH